MYKSLRNIPFIFLGIALFMISCEEPHIGPKRAAIDATKEILLNKTWTLTDYVVSVKNPDIPPPLLVNADDSLIAAGEYHLDDMKPGDADFPIYNVQFTEDNKILDESVDIFLDLGGKYFVWDATRIELHPDGIEKFMYQYFYDPDAKTMKFVLTEQAASAAIDAATQKLIDDIIEDRPDKIGKAISKLIHESPAIQDAIKKLILHAIAGKLPDIFFYDLERTSDSLAHVIHSYATAQVDWKAVLKSLIDKELEKIDNLNDITSTTIYNDIIIKIETEFTVQNIRDYLNPFLAGLDQQDPDLMAEAIATLIANILGDIFSEENLEKLIEPAWEKFVKLDSAQIDTIAFELTDIVQKEWLNVDTLSGVFLPATEKIDETPLFQLDDLAAEATDSLRSLVNKLNATFDSLNLDPDYDKIQSEFYAAFLAAKPVISTLGPEKVAEDIAQIILDSFLTTEKIENAFATVLHELQTIPPETAAATIAGWLVELEKRLEPDLINYLREKLSPIIDKLLSGNMVYRIAEGVHDYVVADFSSEGIEPVLFPFLQNLRNLNLDSLAKKIAKAILDALGGGDDDKGAVAGIILEAFNDVDDPDSDKSPADKIADALADNDIVLSEDRPDIIADIIAFILYKEAWDNFKIANNFKEATIVIQHD